MWSEGSFAYEEDEFSNFTDAEMVDLRVDRDSSVEFTLEEPLAAAPFLVDGLLTGIFFPIRQFIALFCEKSSNAYSKPHVLVAGQEGGGDRRQQGQTFMWVLSFPFGSKIGCIPALSLLFWGCALAMGIQLKNAIDPTDMRTLNLVEHNVSIGDAVVAMTTYGAVVLLAACAIAHHPYLTSRWGVQDVWNEPFQQSTLPCDLPPQQRPNTTEFTGAPSSISDNVAIGPSATADNQGLLDDASPPRKSSVHQASSIRGAGDELKTLHGPKPRRYAPFMHVLLDEIPPLTTNAAADLDNEDDEGDLESVAQRHAQSSLYFLYDTADWFEPQRMNREDIDESLKLFKKVWTDERHAEVERHLARRRKILAKEAAKKAAAEGGVSEGSSRPTTGNRPRTGGSRPGTAGDELGGTITAQDVALLNPNAIEWRASDVFKFTIGDRIRRNEEHPEMQVCFDGVNCITSDDSFVISNRMWANRCALYCVNGAADTHQWQAIEALFDVVEDLTLQLAAGLGNGDANPRKADRVVSIEMMLLGMSGREVLRRIDVHGNGNVAGSVNGSNVPAVSIIVSFLVAICVSIIPIAVRILQGGGLHAEGSIGDLLCAYIPIFLTIMSVSTILSVLESIRRSLTNLEEALVSFTEMTLGAGPRQWAPVLNWYETVNIRSWFLLRQHILGAYHHHMNARVCGVVLVVLGFCSSWSAFGLGFGLTSAYSPPLLDGWAIQALTISLVVVIWCTKNISHAIIINEVVFSHQRHLAKIQAALEEEIMLIMARVAATSTVSVGGGGLASIAAMSAAAGGTMRSQRSASRASSAGSHRQSAVTMATRNTDLQLLLDAKALLEDVRFAIQAMQPPICPFGFTIAINHYHFCLAVMLVNLTALAMAMAGVVQLTWRWKGI